MGIDPDHEPQHPNIKHVIAPERMAGGMSTPTPELEKPSEKKSHRGLIIGLTSGVAGAALAAGAVFGGIAASEAPNTQPVAEAPADPSAVPTPEATSTAEVLTHEALVLPDTLTPEELGTAFVQDRLSTWTMAGATPENQLSVIKAGDNATTVTLEIADKNGDLVADAIMVPNWREIPELASYVEFEKNYNASSIESWFKTFEDGTGDPAYVGGVTVEKTTVVSRDATTLVLTTEATEFNNANENHIAQLAPDVAANNGAKFVWTTTFVQVDGTWRVSAVSSVGRN